MNKEQQNETIIKNFILAIQNGEKEEAKRILAESGWSESKRKVVLQELYKSKKISTLYFLSLVDLEIDEDVLETKISQLDDRHLGVEAMANLLLAEEKSVTPQDSTEEMITRIASDKGFSGKMVQNWFESAGIHLMSQDQLGPKSK